MRELQPATVGTVEIIRSYGPGRVVVGEEEFAQSVLVLPERSLGWSGGDGSAITAFDQITAESLAPVTGADPAIEVLLIGCGARLQRLPKPLREALKAAGVGVDTMDTGAACRTYNVLLAEGRRVAAALIPLPND